MFDLHMVLVTNEAGQRVLRLTFGFRIAFALIAGFIVMGIVTTGAVAAFPVILAILSIVALLYDEKWIFDAEERIATRLSGLLPIHRQKTYSLDDASHFEYAQFAEGSPVHGGSGPTPKRRAFQRQFETLTLVLNNGDHIDIEKQRGRDTGRLQDLAEKLSDYCGIPLRTD